MRDSPRTRRLRNDLKALEELCLDSSIISFTATGDPPEQYVIRFAGKGVWRADGTGDIYTRDHHEVTINLGASYPRMMPELSWKTPIFHPNISASGVVCLGGYGTHWVPSVKLDELCSMLWDMIRYANYDVESPYNREAASWTRVQTMYHLPLDSRPLRDRLASAPADNRPKPASESRKTQENAMDAVLFLGDTEVLDAEIIAPPADPSVDATPASTDDDILFID